MAKAARTVTPAGIAAFAHLNEPDEGRKFSDGMYKTELLFDKEDDKTALRNLTKLMHEVAKEEWGKKPKDLKLPFRDGDEVADKRKEKAEDGSDPYENFRGKVLLKTKSKSKPGAVDAKRNELPEDVFPASGDLMKLSIGLKAYDTAMGKFITAYVNNVQLLKKNSSAGNAADDFEDEEYEGLVGDDFEDEDDSDDDLDDEIPF